MANAPKTSVDELLRTKFEDLGDQIAVCEAKCKEVREELDAVLLEREKFNLEKVKPLVDKLKAIEAEFDLFGIKNEYAKVSRALPNARSTSDAA